MNTLVDSTILANASMSAKSRFAENSAPANSVSKSASVMDENYDRRLQALFEAIIADDIQNRPSPDTRSIVLK